MRRNLIIVGKKKILYTVVMLVGVILPLMVISYYIPSQAVTGQTDKWLDYSSEQEGFSFKYPQGWLLRTEKNYSGGEIIESVSFWKPDQTAHGFVQVMKLAKTIPDYIHQAEQSMAPGFDSLQFKPFTEGDKQGYVLTYMRGTGDYRSVATEYFFQKGDKVFRLSFFYPESMEEEYSKVLADMKAGFKF